MSGVCNQALLVLLRRSGLQISEALARYPRDIETARGSLRVRHGKGKKTRVVGMDATAFAELETWEVRRAKRGFTDAQPVFCTLQGKPMLTAYLRALLPRLARKAGITKRVHAHG
jgi:integrase/recombinase XerC